MFSRTFATVALYVVALCCFAESRYERIHAELVGMADRDQAARRVGATTSEQHANEVIQALNVKHAMRLKGIVDEIGWPTKDMVGEDGARAAWLIVQHADHDPAFQADVLAILEPLVASGEVAASEYAYLWDRIHTPQRFGTQGECRGDGAWVVKELESPATVNALRASVGLFPERIEDYVEMAASLCREHG